ncbi:MAG: hypothetical protein VX899_17135 [Myxococcota bacterium]|nr:hypothetical protein [Myxococcota bacterium]
MRAPPPPGLCLPALGLFALGLLIHGLWALSIPVPVDWDPAYYREIAGNIAAGEGAVTHAGVLWGLAELGLPQPADLHWSPLPSRVLVPGLWLWPAHGDQLVSVVLGALWAPLAWVIARSLKASPRSALLAGLIGATGLGYARFLSTPDSIALAGVCGGLLTWGLASRRWWLAAMGAALLALTRGEGFLVAGLAGVALLSRRELRGALMVGGAGILSWGAWQARCVLVGGEIWLSQRAQVAVQVDYLAFVRAESSSSSLLERLGFVVGELPEAALIILLASAVLGLPLAGGASRQRGQAAWIRAFWLTLFALPVLVLGLAPAVAASGSVFRSLACLAPAMAALMGVGLERAAEWGSARRGYPPAFVFTLGLLGVGGLSLGVGWSTLKARPSRALSCPELKGPVLASDPLSLADRCGVDAWLLPGGAQPDAVRDLVRSQGISEAVIREGDGLAMDPEQAAALLGWTLDPQGVLRSD